MEMFQALDWVVVALYFAVVMGIAVRVMRKRAKDSADYFLASRHVGWYVIGSSILASNIGSEHIVGLAGTGASSGVALGHYELHSWCVLLLGWVFVPFYLRSRVFTMPEFLELRYTPKARWDGIDSPRQAEGCRFGRVLTPVASQLVPEAQVNAND